MQHSLVMYYSLLLLGYQRKKDAFHLSLKWITSFMVKILFSRIYRIMKIFTTFKINYQLIIPLFDGMEFQIT